ncbi:MAG: glycosyl hydrolase [Saprospiraceae bacterium]|nr:glycosyl hydrolase [Saprospiraceae bacterium]
MQRLLLTTLITLGSLIAVFGQGIELSDYFKPLKYRNIGPFRGGRSVCATGVIGDPLTYYMGTTGGGVWKTDDAGQHWKNISDGFFGTGSVGAVAVSASDPNVVYVGMGEHAPRGVMTSYGDGVYKSTDAGKTWKHIGLKETQQISRIIIHPKNPDVVYVAAQGQLNGNNPDRGIFKSTDGGATWKKMLYVNDRTGCSELSMDATDPNILYAAMWEHQRLPWKVISGGPGSGLYKSMDGGATWKEMTEGLPKEKGKMAIAVCPSNSEKVYALIESDSDQEKGGLFVSADAGKSWSRISADHQLVQRAWYYIEVFADPKDENTVYVLSAPALRSIDGGKTWETLGGTHGDFHDLWINPNNSKNLCISNDGGAAISFNHGASWSTQGNMPTGQFYRINVDNGFPYRIYAGQQDNTSISIASMEMGSYGISTRSWAYSAGGESAFLAFDPDNPRYVLGGSYQGTIEVLDNMAQAATNIMAAPIEYLGRDASDMKYRFNWNAPIIWSQHEPNTYYHGAQVLLRTRDMGKTWEEASPDLTRNEKEKQGKGGGPYTNEAVGAENYGTISYIMESPHEKGVIWVGSDDGYVHLTRDGGASWTNVTPKTLQECLVNAIEVSPHAPGTAYIATTRYKFNDHTPKLMKTTDYGKTWTDITGNIPYGAYTRVVREDNVRKDLLFAGTETGLYLSWNGGKNWEKFNLNLPVTPIQDLMIKHDDLIVATSGRAFWILDDMGLLRQYQAVKDQPKLYTPEETWISNHGSELNGNSANFDGTNPLRGVNPAGGVVIYYYLPEALGDSTDLTLTITDKNGNLVRRLSSKADKTYQSYEGAPPAEPTLSKKKGLNRFVWDMRYPTITGIPFVYIEVRYEGHKTIPGEYGLQLSIGDKQLKTNFNIRPNPLYGISADEYAAYHQFMTAAEKEVNTMHQMVNDLMKLQTQLSAIIAGIEGDKHQALKKEAQELVKKMKTWDEEMVQRKSKAYDDVENFPNKFTANYLFAVNHAESGIPLVNQPTRDRIAELDVTWKKLKQEGEAMLNTAVPTLNNKLWEAGIGALWLGK